MLIRLPKSEIESIVKNVKFNIPSDDLDEMAIPSYLHNNPLINWLFWRRLEFVTGLATKFEFSQVLDFGCGIGSLLPSLCYLAKGQVHATDLHPEIAKELIIRRQLNVVFHDADKIEAIKPRSLDLIVAADSMEHLEEPKFYLDIFREKLLGRGRLIISGPTESRIYHLGRLMAGFKEKGNYHHSNVYNLKGLILDSGFKLKVSKGIPFWIPPHLFKIYEFEKI